MTMWHNDIFKFVCVKEREAQTERDKILLCFKNHQKIKKKQKKSTSYEYQKNFFFTLLPVL